MRAPLTVLVLFAAGGIAAAQVYVHVPDDLPAAGLCNATPFGAFQPPFIPTPTYLARIPASYLDPANPLVSEIAFAPCGTGSFTAARAFVVLGHVPSPQPCPFTFPQFDILGTLLSPGSFIDLVIVHSSASQGPFTFVAAVQDAWNDAGFAAQGGTSFVWNGIDDVAFYMTYENASLGGTWIGDCRRTATEPARSYASTYMAPVSIACLSPAGVKMRLTVGPAVPGFASIGNGCAGTGGTPVLSSVGGLLPTLGNAGFGLQVQGAAAGVLSYWYMANRARPSAYLLGPGCWVHLDLVSFLIYNAVGFNPVAIVPVDALGAAALAMPVGTDPALLGVRIAFQVFVDDTAAPAGFTVTNAVDMRLGL